MTRRLSSGLLVWFVQDFDGWVGTDVVRLMGGGRGALMRQTRGTAQVQTD